MAEPEFWFDQAAADAAVDFFHRYVRYTKGEWAGRPFVLAPWQEHEIIRPAFGWRRADGTRRYRTVYIVVGGKNGKSELLGGVSHLLLLGDGEIGGEGYVLAAGMDQASIVFNRSQIMAQYEPELGKHLELLKRSTFCPELNAVFRPLAGTPAGKTGLNPHFVLGDETHEWTDGTLYLYVVRGMGSRRQPMAWLITTGGKRGGFGWELHERMLKIHEGKRAEPEILVVIYAADKDDDWTDPRTWEKPNPNLDISIKRTFLESEFRAAQDSPRLEANFRSYHLCQWGQSHTKWLKPAKWAACTVDPENERRWAELEAELEGRACYGGLDLSSTTDLSALVWMFPPIEPGEPWKYLCRFWLPEATPKEMEERIRRDGVPYDEWIRDGALEATPGNVIDYDAIEVRIMGNADDFAAGKAEKLVRGDAERFRIKGLSIDPWNATQVAVNLQKEGLPIVFFRQGFASMNAPAKEFERRVIDGTIEHGNHPVLAWMAENVCVETDTVENIKPSKKHSAQRIDGIVSAVMATAEASPDDKDEMEVVTVPSDYEAVSV